MKVPTVCIDPIVGCQIKTPAKPPDGLLAWRLGDKAAHIHMGRRYMGIVGMKDQRHAHGFKAATGYFWAMMRSRWGHLFTSDMGKADAPFFEDVATIYRTSATITLKLAIFGLMPLISDKGFAIESTHGTGNTILQAPKVILEGGDVEGGRLFSQGISLFKRVAYFIIYLMAR
jgi:hypothetical protein